MDNFLGMPGKKLRFPSKLWFKFQWYKRIKRVNIVGFYTGIPIIATDCLEEYREDDIMEELESSFLDVLWKE